MAADVEVKVEMFDQLVGQKISLGIEIGRTQRRSPVDAEVDGPLNGGASKQSTMLVIEYSEMPFAVARKGQDFEIPIRAQAKVLSSSKRQFDRFCFTEIF